MAELNDLLGKVMSDPSAMQQISALAQSLGLQAPSPPQLAPSPPPPMPPTSQPSASPSASQLMSSLLQLSRQQTGDEGIFNLFQALKPFLRPERAQRLDLAIQVARISRLAGTTLQGLASTGSFGR